MKFKPEMLIAVKKKAKRRANQPLPTKNLTFKPKIICFTLKYKFMFFKNEIYIGEFCEKLNLVSPKNLSEGKPG